MAVAYRLQKTSDIHRKYAILIELLDAEDVLLSVGITDDGVLDLVFGAEIAERTFGPELLEWIARAMAVTLAENTLHADT